MKENLKIAEIFEDIAFLLEIKDENPFKIRSYKRVAELIKKLRKPLRIIRDEKKLRELEGVGDAISKKIEEILDTGDCNLRRKLLKEFSEDFLKLRKIKGVGPKTAKKIAEKFGTKINLKKIISNPEIKNVISESQFKKIEEFVFKNE